MLGEGVKTKLTFCDVLIGRDPAGGIIITLPPHTGPVTLTFDLHNRHTYSEELIKTNRALPPLHGDDRRADDGQHAALAGGRAERVPDGRRPGRSRFAAAAVPAGSRRWRRPALSRSCIVVPSRGRERQHPRREADGRPRRRHRQLHRARPADRHHQQRDARVPARAGAPQPAPARRR